MNCGEKITSDVPSVLRARHKLIHGLTSTETIKGFKMQSLCFFFNQSMNLLVKVVLCFPLLVVQRSTIFNQNLFSFSFC